MGAARIKGIGVCPGMKKSRNISQVRWGNSRRTGKGFIIVWDFPIDDRKGKGGRICGALGRIRASFRGGREP